LRFSSTDIYVFKALAHLGALPPGAVARGDEIAASAGVPRPYLMRLLAALVSRGVVTSQKGAGGGFALARPAERVSLAEVLRAVDGPVAPLSCTSLNWHKGCPEESRCRARNAVWVRVRDAILGVLEASSVADLVADRERGVDYGLCLEHLLRPGELAPRAPRTAELPREAS
jgi:Rrf2 family protein